MEKLILSEQEIVNSVCVFIASKIDIKPQEVEVELMYDDDKGFSAEAYVGRRSQVITTAIIIEAIRYWLEHYKDHNPYAGIKLILDDEEGIIAYIN